MVNCQSISYKTVNYKLFLALPKVWFVNWALVARRAGNDCPSLVLLLPVTCSPTAQHVFSGSPSRVHHGTA